MTKENSWGQRKLGFPSITLEQALLLIILESGQKGLTHEEIRQRAEEEGIYFSDLKILTNLKGLEIINLVRPISLKSTIRWYPILEVAQWVN